MDVCSGVRPNLLLAGGTGLARRGTGARVSSSGSPCVKSIIVAKPAPGGSWAGTVSACSIARPGPYGPSRVPSGSQLRSLPCAAIPIPTPVPSGPSLPAQSGAGRAEGRVPGVPCPFLSLRLAVRMFCSLQTIPGTGSGRYQLRGRETILERVPGLKRPPAPSPGGSRCHVQTRHVCQINAAEPGGDGAIQGASQGMHEGWDASSDWACCYRHRLQLRQLPWPTKICSLCRRIRPFSLPAFPLFQSLLPCVDGAGARPSGRGGHGSEGHREWEGKLSLLFAHHPAPQRQPAAQGSSAARQPSCPGWAVAAASCPDYPSGDCSQRC